MEDNNQSSETVNMSTTELLPLREAAEYGEISVSHLRNLLAWGRVQGRKLGTVWFTTKAAIEQYKALGNKPGPKPKETTS